MRFLLAILVAYVMFTKALQSAFASDVRPQLYRSSSMKDKYRASITTRYESLIITEQNLLVNCTHLRPSILINGTSPGPRLHFKTNERVIINVTNMMKDKNFTMHWHGLSQTASPWSDGTSMISQWPIAPQNWFQYEFFLSQENIGTYFYHAHIGLQLSTAFGSLIITPSEPCKGDKPQPQDLDLMISDFWYKTDDEVQRGLLGDPFVWPGSSSEIYLNGLSNQTSCGPDCGNSYPVFNIHPDSVYRLRWIHAGSLMYVSLGIQAHQMTLIEADGTDLLPIALQHLEVAPGQRYSTLLHSKSLQELQSDGQDGIYVIRLSSRWRSPAVQNIAILRYILPNTHYRADDRYIHLADRQKLVDAKNQVMLPAEQFGWQDRNFSALVESAPPINIEQHILVLESRQALTGRKGLQWQMNGRSYRDDQTDTPYLVKLYQRLALCSSASCRSKLSDLVSDTYILKTGQVVDIVIVNGPGLSNKTEIHPWHFHSRAFWVMARGMGSFHPDKIQESLFPKPYRRDTVAVYPGPGATIYNETLAPGESGGWTMIRYQASAKDAGVFPLHCHVVPHLVNGMAVLFTVSPSTLPKLLDSYRPYLQWKGEPYGNSTWTPEEPSWFLDKDNIDQQDLANEQKGCATDLQ